MDRRLELLDILGITEDMLMKVVQGRAFIKYEEQIGSISPFRNINSDVFGTTKVNEQHHNYEDYYKVDKFETNKHVEAETTMHEEIKVEPEKPVESNRIQEEETMSFQLNDNSTGWTKAEPHEEISEESVMAEILDAGVIEADKPEKIKTPIQNTVSGSEDKAKVPVTATTNNFSGSWGTTPIFTNEKTENVSTSSSKAWMSNPWENKNQ